MALSLDLCCVIALTRVLRNNVCESIFLPKIAIIVIMYPTYNRPKEGVLAMNASAYVPHDYQQTFSRCSFSSLPSLLSLLLSA